MSKTKTLPTSQLNPYLAIIVAFLPLLLIPAVWLIIYLIVKVKLPTL